MNVIAVRLQMVQRRRPSRVIHILVMQTKTNDIYLMVKSQSLLKDSVNVRNQNWKYVQTKWPFEAFAIL